MATKKSAGVSKNGRDSGPQYLGVKVTPGNTAGIGAVLVRQRGTVIMPGKNVGLGKDHTLFALKAGTVEIKNKRKVNFDNSYSSKKILNILVK